MKRTFILCFALTGLFLLKKIEAYEINTDQSCFFVSLAKVSDAYVGYNEDGQEMRTKIWLIPAESKVYDRIIWGFDRALDPYQGGMNTEGLFVDINSCENTRWKKDLGNPDWNPGGDEIDYFLSDLVNRVVKQTGESYLKQGTFISTLNPLFIPKKNDRLSKT